MADEAEPNPMVVRIGLAMITVVMLAAIVLAIVLDAPAARVIFAGIAVVGALQTWRLYRGVRSD